VWKVEGRKVEGRKVEDGKVEGSCPGLEQPFHLKTINL
jgi:hypothetical protein